MEIQNRNASLILQVVCFWAKLWMTNGPIHCVPPSPKSCFSSQGRSFHHKYHLIANIVLSRYGSIVDTNFQTKFVWFPSAKLLVCWNGGGKFIWGFYYIFKKKSVRFPLGGFLLYENGWGIFLWDFCKISIAFLFDFHQPDCFLLGGWKKICWDFFVTLYSFKLPTE